MYHAVNSCQTEYVVRKVSRDNASLVEEYIFNCLDPLFTLDVTKCAINFAKKSAVYFVVDNLLTRCIRESKSDTAYQIIEFCKSFFNETYDSVNCLECLRFAIEEMYFYILNDDKINMVSSKSALEKLISDATKVSVKEDKIEKENALQKESLEKNKKWLEEQHKEDKNKWLITPKCVLDVCGSFYSEERGIKRFKNELIKIATALLDAVEKLSVGTDSDPCAFISELKFPTYIDFGLYKGWLLDIGERRCSFIHRMHSLAAQSRERKEILFIDIDEE